MMRCDARLAALPDGHFITTICQGHMYCDGPGHRATASFRYQRQLLMMISKRGRYCRLTIWLLPYRYILLPLTQYNEFNYARVTTPPFQVLEMAAIASHKDYHHQPFGGRMSRKCLPSLMPPLHFYKYAKPHLPASFVLIRKIFS